MPEALHRLTEAYLSIGVVDEARKTAAVLGHNFPGSEWYIDSYEKVCDDPKAPKYTLRRSFTNNTGESGEEVGSVKDEAGSVKDVVGSVKKNRY